MTGFHYDFNICKAERETANGITGVEYVTVIFVYCFLIIFYLIDKAMFDDYNVSTMKIKNMTNVNTKETKLIKYLKGDSDLEEKIYFLTLASEKSLAKDWLRPEEEEAWKSLI